MKKLDQQRFDPIVNLAFPSGRDRVDKISHSFLKERLISNALVDVQSKLLEEEPVREEEGQAEEQSEKLVERFRTAGVNDRTVSMELKMLRPARDAAKHIATAHNMTAQQYVEHLLIDALNKYPRAVQEGKKRLEKFKGSTKAATRFAERIELERLRELQQTARPSK